MSKIQHVGSVLGLANQIKRVFDTTTGGCGAQVRILYYILSTYQEKEIYQKDIEEELHIRSSSVSVLLKKMEANAIIHREKVTDDDRLKRILPTKETMKLKEQVALYVSLFEKHLTDGVTAEELNIFSNVIKKMQENMDSIEKDKAKSFMIESRKLK